MTLREYVIQHPEFLDWELDIPTEGNPPYIYTVTVDVSKRWNDEYDQDAECKCGHPYYRHFDSYEQMENVGCKYCRCDEFKPKAI